MPHTFLSIAAPAESLFKEKGSRFIGLAFPVQTEEDVRATLQQLKQQYWDARHHCYAFVLGPDRQHYRSSDAGEPAHSAGTPILGQIRSRELTNVLVVVIRYFGGTKLGVPGLIAAYKAAAAEALDAAGRIELEELVQLEGSFPYASLTAVMRQIKEQNATIKFTDYQEICRITLEVSKANAPNLLRQLEKIHPTEVQFHPL